MTTSSETDAPAKEEPTSLRELALLFLRLGATSFGGPAAHIALMREEVVLRRRWLSEEQILDLISATNLIPGPSSTELAIHIGWHRRGWAGLWVAGLCFILPAMVITGALGWVYVRYGALPELGWVLYGVKPVVLAVVVQAIAGLAPKAARSWALRGLGVLAAVLVAMGVPELAVLFGAGGLVAASRWGVGRGTSALGVPWIPLDLVGGSPSVPVELPVSLSTLFWVFARIGSVLFGSGYVLVAFLRSELVERLGWLSEAQLIDAIAVGQVTPGPVFTTATFIGYLLAGPEGALVATVGIFLPAFVFVALSGPLVPRLRSSAVAGGFLDGVNVASLALMAVVTAQLAGAAVVDGPTAALGIAAAVLLIRARVDPTLLVLGGAVLGVLVHG